MYVIGHNSLLSGQAAVSQRNDHMLTWFSTTGGGSASYLITDARLSLLRNCPGEDRPLHSSGDLTAHRVLCTQSYQFQQDHASACTSARCCLPLYTPHLLASLLPPTLFLPPVLLIPWPPPQVSQHCSRQQFILLTNLLSQFITSSGAAAPRLSFSSGQKVVC